ncbi:HAD family hydrolase [Kushneria phosphatilytica]|uniref:HAD-IA family hydrolase n=1 Tax=Kushneria phosphatilytica TaxID=657387 RepID=A0A1S1NYL1_9GAMM|nr:HAD-IA family hydrolase [Kushneria phosphatilytica]OHV11943.1 phosphoglycolate phosphatase [Kushneria phosphatilytica]QEL11124.1 HAD-IA family hydrolase [Kushneria phosphatilytica]
MTSHPCIIPVPRAVLFDLDGTLVDTAPDLAHATNALRQAHALPPLPYDVIRAEVSHGGNALVTLALGYSIEHPEHAVARHWLLEAYGRNVAEASRIFEGLESVLKRYTEQSRPWGIITNKPRRYAEPLLKALKLVPDVLLCADDLPVKKPDPEPLLEAARRLNVLPEECWYIGDHQRDMEAAMAAGMTAVAVHYGYLRDGDDPMQWPAHQHFDTPSELAAMLLSH